MEKTENIAPLELAWLATFTCTQRTAHCTTSDLPIVVPIHYIATSSFILDTAVFQLKKK